MLLNRLVFAFLMAFLSLAAGCGGGGGGGGAPQTSSPTLNQAILGPLSGATIRAYRFADLNTVVEGPITAGSDTSSLATAGSFELSLSGITDTEWVVVSATGGSDLDADDDGQADATPTPNNGTVRALATAKQWREGGVHITPLTQIAWHYCQDIVASGDASQLSARLNDIARTLVQTDIDGDGSITYADLQVFNPSEHQQNLKIDYTLLLPDSDSSNQTLIELIHSNAGETTQRNWVTSNYGETPWIEGPANQNPTADAGSDQVVIEGSTVTLSGSGSDSDGSLTSLVWSQTAGTLVNLSSTTESSTTFTAPTTSVELTLVFQLQVTDDQSATATDTVEITVSPVNTPPNANAGIDQSVESQSLVSLTGTGSDADGTISQYSWSQVSGTGVSLVGASSATSQFVAPSVSVPTTLTFRLTVTDNEGATGTDTIDVTITPLNALPTANAGLDKTVDEQTTVVLNGSGTDSDGTVVSYNWVQTDGETVSLTNPSTAAASFEAPATLSSLSLTFRLTVEDNEGAQHSDTVTITVLSTRVPPEAPDPMLVERSISGALDVSWSTALNADGYNLYVASDSGITPGNWATLANSQLIPDVSSPYRVTGLQNGQRYYVIVSAENTIGETASTEKSAVPYGRLNDTGVTWGGSYPSGNNADCSGTEITAQDCSHGRDAQPDEGGGHAGFDFTKLNATGAVIINQSVDYSTQPWRCVRDNVTGLVWEVKTDDTGPHDKDNTYQWGGISAQGSGYGTYYNDWNALVDAANTASLCGFSDWRVPTRRELVSIANLFQISPAIDTTYFPNTPSNTYFWSSTPTPNSSGNAWSVFFANGFSTPLGRDTPRAVRLVRGGE